MSLRSASLVGLVAVACGISGCALLLVGAGAAGGYAISKDSVKNVFDLPRDHVYGRSFSVVKEMGVVTLEDRAHGRLKGIVQEVNITVTVRPLTKRTVELKVSGRNRFWMPKVDVAQEIYNKIAEHL